MFELGKYHKKKTKYYWEENGLLLNSEDEFEYIYNRYITSTNCEYCNKAYKNTRDRCMDHAHYIFALNKKGKKIAYGSFRAVCCNKCNVSRRNTDNISINRLNDKPYYKLRIERNGKNIISKCSYNKMELHKIRYQFIIDNPQLFPWIKNVL